MNEFNQLLKEYAAWHEDTTFVDQINHPIGVENPTDVGDYQKVRRDIFVEDKVHPKQEGYNILRDIFLEVLDDLL